ncbi:MAG: MFS transporter [Citrobacter freundii]|nr:MAG: MFS transporter [Citrobacter freundii]
MVKNKRLILITLMLGTSMAAIDSSIVNVSLPVIRNHFNADVEHVQWVVTAYMISFCLFIPLTSWLKNRIGYFYLYTGCVTVFTIGSLLCSLSVSLDMLVFARIIQAVGGGAMSPTSLAILSDTFPKEERGSAIGWWGIGNVMGPALGPTLGGVLTHYFGWPSVFYINIPIGILTLWMNYRYLGFLKKIPISKPKFDLSGFTFFSLFIVSVQYATSTTSRKGLGSIEFIFGLLACILSFYFFMRSSRKPDPLLDLTVFKSATFNRAAIVVVIRSVALFGGMFFIPFLLQGQVGFSEVQSGLLMLPNALMMLVTRPFAGRMADKGLTRNISVAGILIVSISFIFFSRIDPGTSVGWIIVSMMIRGLGMSLLVAPVSTALLNSVGPFQTATATSMNSLLQQLGGSIGIALSTVAHSYIYAYYEGKNHPPEMAEHFALQWGFMLTSFIILLAIIPALKLPEKAILFKDRQEMASE